jgi:hypothetical protein
MATSQCLQRFFLCLAIVVALVASRSSLAQAPSNPVSVWTWHNDNGRTGQNASETVLAPSLRKTTFGLLFS